MRSSKSSLLIVFLSFIYLACVNHTSKKEMHTANGIIEVQLGDQVWMGKNFDGVTFRNGDTIPLAKSIEEWERANRLAEPAWCYYNNDTSIGRKYGRIYNWYAINDPRGFSPIGWHVPSNDEWIKLEDFLGPSTAGLRLRSNMDRVENAGNSFDFGALMGGYRGREGGFSGVEEFTYLFSSSERDPKEDDIWGRGLHSTDSTIMRCGMFKGHGLYVRLVKN